MKNPSNVALVAPGLGNASRFQLRCPPCSHSIVRLKTRSHISRQENHETID